MEMKTAIYARVSTRDKGQDIENQLAQLRDFAARISWTVVSEYLDHETGKHSDREQFKRMFQDASQRKFDVVLFWSLDRLSREGVLETLQHLQRLTDYGVEWRSLTEQYLDSTGIFRDAVISILATVAKQERIRISERVTAGLARARSKGKQLGRPKVIVDAARIADLRASGASWRDICDQTGLSKGTAQRALQNLPKNPGLPKTDRESCPKRVELVEEALDDVALLV
jgi:DNA invertase Pin-like site-specific DNA recombinase